MTDHVRSIVRECLQEADVHWTSSYNTDPNNYDCGEEFNGNNRFSDERANLVGNYEKLDALFHRKCIYRYQMTFTCNH